jgi:hypothetical protein
MQLYLFSFLFLHYMFRLHAAIFRWFSSSSATGCYNTRYLVASFIAKSNVPAAKRNLLGLYHTVK